MGSGEVASPCSPSSEPLGIESLMFDFGECFVDKSVMDLMTVVWGEVPKLLW